MQFHELFDALEHVVVAASRRVHLLKYRRHVPEYCRIQQRCRRTQNNTDELQAY